MTLGATSEIADGVNGLPDRVNPAGLIVPTTVEKLEEASNSKAGFLHLEVEDGVPDDEKPRARELVVQALRELDWSGKVTMVRINGPDTGLVEEDIEVVTAGKPTAVMAAKCGGPEDVLYIARLLSRAEKRHGLADGTIRIVALIERLTGLHRIHEVAACSPRLLGLTVGPTDLGNEYGFRRTYRGLELETFWVKSQIVFAAHSAGLLAIDPPLVSFGDPEEAREQAQWSYHLGFDAKMTVTVRHVDAVNAAFSPSVDEVSWAEHICSSEVKDMPYGYVKRARKLLERAANPPDVGVRLPTSRTDTPAEEEIR